MTIEISGLSNAQIKPAADANQAAKEVTQQESAQASSVDKVSLSDNAINMGNIESQIAEAPIVDTQRVEAMKQAIADGSYEVDPQRVAEKLLQFEKDFSDQS